MVDVRDDRDVAEIFPAGHASTVAAWPRCYDLSSLDRKDMLMQRWQLQDAKQQFSRLVERARSGEPQLVTRNGKEVAVLLDVDEYRRLTSHGGDFKKFLMSAPDFDLLEIERSKELPRIVEL
jgi:prevent-host-death family protein